MFHFSLCASLTALVASAVTVSAARSLSVKTSIPNVNVDGLGNLKVTTTIINTGNEFLKLLNDPRGVLDPFPENTFIITDLARSRRPRFNGAMVNYSPTYAAGLDDPSVFTVLAPGASVDVTHDLSAAYNFSLSGAGNYSIKPSSLFTYIDHVDGTPKDLHATVEDIPEVRLSGNLIVSRVLNRRDGERQGCTPLQSFNLDLAIGEADVLIEDAILFLGTRMNSPSPPPRWTTWFGETDECAKEYALDVFMLMRSPSLVNVRYKCIEKIGYPTSIRDSDGGDGRVIELYTGFWPLITTGTDSQAGSLIREATHFGIGIENIADGETRCRQLPMAYPNRPCTACLQNADSYRYFAEDPDYYYNEDL